MTALTFTVAAAAGYVLVHTNWRLQHWGSDKILYANTDFVPPEGSSELLKKIIDLARLNNSGINHMEVEPFRFTLYGGTLTEGQVSEMMLTAARRAGMHATKERAR